MISSGPQIAFPDQPVLVRLWRGTAVESQHRGAWVLCDPQGRRLDGAGESDWPIFARSSVKALQALPLVETGAAQRFGFGPQELALAVSSHNAETCHVETVERMLRSLDLSVANLQCGPQSPGDSLAREALRLRHEQPSALHNNCSGKHAGFLALGLQLGDAPEHYLDAECKSQRAVQQAVLEMARLDASKLELAIDGCSAPTFRLPLSGMATAFARLATPRDLGRVRGAACTALCEAVAANPVLIAGTRGRLCSEIARITRGRLFPKIGAEGVYVIGECGGERGLALKIDDGGERALSALVVALLERLKLATADEVARLESWREQRLQNRAGLEVGRTEVLA